jgi:hypothetical protein
MSQNYSETNCQAFPGVHSLEEIVRLGPVISGDPENLDPSRSLENQRSLQTALQKVCGHQEPYTKYLEGLKNHCSFQAGHQ